MKCSFTLRVLTRNIFGNHMVNFGLHPLPKEVTTCQLKCFDEPRVRCRWRIMEFIKDCMFKVCALGKH